MKKTIFALLLVVVLAAVLAIPAMADTPADVYHCECGAKWFASADAETPSIKNEVCMEGCDEEKNLTWKPLTGAPKDQIPGQWCANTGNAEWSVSEDYNFYLTGPVETTYKLKLGDTAYGGVKGTTVRVDLNGNSYQRTANNVFQVTGGSRLVITDTSSGKKGVLGTKTMTAEVQGVVVVNSGTAKQFAGTVDGSAYASKAGSTNVSVTGGTYYMYGGQIVSGKSSAGGNVRVTGGEFHMYDGTISGGVASERAGNVLVTAGTFHMHDGTISGGATTGGTAHGGNVHVREKGTFIMDDGEIFGGNAGAANGGNVALISADSKVTINGGSITGGKAATGPCVYKLAGTMTVSGDPEIDSIYLVGGQKIAVGEDGLKPGANIGILMQTTGVFVSTDATEADAAYFDGASGKHSVRYANGVLSLAVTPWKLNGKGDRLTHDEAKAALKEGDYLQLQYNWATAPEFTGNVCLDLNGHTLNGLKITDGKLNLFDSETNDYDVSDGVYGKITGDITASEIVPAFVASNGYRYVTIKTDEGYSAHRFYLAVTHAVLRADYSGLNYKTMFKCNEKVAELINNGGAYGLNLKVNGELIPVDKTTFSGTVAAGENGNERTTKIIGLNTDNAENYMTWGQEINAYITVNGETIVSAVKTTSMKDMILRVMDNQWDSTDFTDAKKDNLAAIYNTYGPAAGMDNWGTAVTEKLKPYAEAKN